MRQIGQAVGAAVFGGIFNLGLYSRVPDAGDIVARLVDPVRRGLIPPLDLARDAGAIAASLHGVFLILFALALAASGLALALPPHLRPGHITGAPVRGQV
jgi:hypothetical protein